MSIRNTLAKLNVFNSVVYTALFLFSYWLMFKTFSYDAKNGFMILAPIIQSDFAAHIPLIRSFSLGSNWPPEYPLYPGPPIQYHFLFFFLVGMLEKIGFRIDWALNFLSITGFFGMLAMTYAIAKKILNDSRAGLLSVIFFIFNGTLSFLYYFTTKESFSLAAIKKIFVSKEYASFGPWDGSPILIFWNLNTYINQRHFCLALGVLLTFIFTALNIHKQSKMTQLLLGIVFGLIFGSFPLLHKPVMLLAGLVMAVYFVAFANMRLFLFTSGGVSLACMIFLYLSSFKIDAGENSIAWNIGFLVPDPHSLTSYIKFFFYQFGFHCILIPIGFLLASRTVKIIMIPAILALIISFVLRFSIDVSANHKLINFTIIMLQMLSALAIVRAYDAAGFFFWNSMSKAHQIIHSCINTMLGILLLSLTLSGIMDLFVVINQDKGERVDVPSSKVIEWIAHNTPKDAVILNSTFIFDPASVAGRKIFLGYAYFIVSSGYDFGGRVLNYREIYTSDNPLRIIKLLNENNISYVEFSNEMRNGQNLEVKNGNEALFKKFFPLVFDGKDDTYDNTTIYKVPSEKEWYENLSAEQKKQVANLKSTNQDDNFINTEVGAGGNKLLGHAVINVDTEGNIYVLEISSSTLQKYSPDGYLLETIGSQGDQPGQMKDPNGFTTDKEGNIYIADTWNHRIQKLSPTGDVITDWKGAALQFFAPNRIRIADDGSLYIMDTGHHRVVKLSADGKTLLTFGKQGNKNGEFNEPTDLVIADDKIYVADTGNLRIAVFTLEGKFIKTWPIKHWDARSWNKFRLAWNPKNEHLYISNFVTGKIFVHKNDGEYLGVIIPKSKDVIDGISDISVSRKNELFAFDTRNARILKIHNKKPVKSNDD